VSVATAAVALIALGGCGGGNSKPAYCSERTNLQNSVQALSASGGISALQSQLKTVQKDATSLVNSAKSDFPSETSAIKSSLDTLTNAVKTLPSSPSSTQIAAIAADIVNVANSVKSFNSATSSACS